MAPGEPGNRWAGGQVGVLFFAAVYLSSVPLLHSGIKTNLLLGYRNLNGPGKYRWLRAVIPFAMVYLVVGVLLPDPR